MAPLSGEDRSDAPRLHRRDLGQDEHDAHPWPRPSRRAPRREGAARTLADADLPRGVAPRSNHSPLRVPINGESVLAYVRQVLAPTLTPGDVVVLDNLGSHKGHAVRAVGAHLLFLPPYSPDLNPIEQVFAKLKALLRKAAERTVEATWKRIGSLLHTFKPTECAAYFRNAGYASN